MMTITRDKLDTMDFSDVSDGTRLAPVHPGEVLLYDFMEPLEVTQYRLAVTISVPPRRINEIVHGKRAITADTALRLGQFFGTTPEFWMALQASYDTETAREKIATVLASIPLFSRIQKERSQRLAA
ncbi:MAG: HigA family addiction module antitoxin [Geobacter sp.]|jgi:antitoxin HigA-1|nr:HigA family addiction module antitoxin [Trichlorobacter sp.]MDY0385250.1 HigA family addiction module antitoxin [Trichlorobacter sp.]